MSKTTSANPVASIVTAQPTSHRRVSSLNQGSFWLVVIMLLILFVLVGLLLVLTCILAANDKFIEYSQWTLSVLVGAFGAWIGAGAAYFFGKENLVESSASTEEALRIQLAAWQGRAQPERIKDVPLTAINTQFMFNLTDLKKDVVSKLSEHSGYWWVPVLTQDGEGVLADVIHARVFWETAFEDYDPIAQILTRIDTEPTWQANLIKLHGPTFFMKVTLESKIAEVVAEMNKLGTAVGIVVDEKGRPVYCVSKQDLLNVQK